MTTTTLGFRDYFRQELVDLLTDPSTPVQLEEAWCYLDDFDSYRKLPRRFKMIDDLLCRCGQDLRLTPDEIDDLRQEILV